MIKRILIAALLWPVLALAQSYPSPTFQNLTVLGTLTPTTISGGSYTGSTFTNPTITGGTISGLSSPLPVASGGTNSASASGTALDNITGFNSTGFMSRSGAGSYTFSSRINLTSLANQAANTVLANVTSGSTTPTAFAMPTCSTSSSAVNYTTNTGFGCNTAINAATLGGATFAAPGPIGSTTPGTGAFTTLSATSAPTLGAATFFPTVATNAALQALSTATTSTVTRLSFATSGDTPPLTYVASGSACSLNAGAGDNGSQVQSSNSKCWIAQFPKGALDVTEWGVVANGATTDNTTALQNAWNYGGTVNTDILLPPSTPTNYIKFSTINAPIGTYTAGPYAYGPLSAIRGRGVGQTFMQTTVAGTTCAINFNPASGTYSDGNAGRGLYDLALLSSGSGVGYGICINASTGIIMSNFMVDGFSRGIYATDAIRIRIDNPQLFQNVNAIYAVTAGNSPPNQWVITNPLVANSTGDAFYFLNGADIDIYGGDFEGNNLNVAGTGNFATIHMQGNPIAGNKGLSVFGGYYENNGGNADFRFDQLVTDGSAAHLISGIVQDRISNTTFVNSPIALYNNNGSTGVTHIDVRDSAFLGSGTYVPSSARQYIAVAAPATANYRITGYDSNSYSSSVESPWNCTPGTKCMNLPDGHIMQWGTATTSSATPGVVAVTWPLACPSAVDTLSTSGQNGAGAVATGAASITVTGANLYTSSGPAGLQWQLLCH